MIDFLRPFVLPAFTGLALLAATSAHANNIQIANTTLINNAGNAKVQFDLSWENSWRGGGVINWDAAWVFVKYRLPNGQWQHAYVNSTGHIVPAAGQVDLGLLTPGSAPNAVSNPVVGVFIRRSAAGTGTFSLTGIQLDWNLSDQGVNYNDISAVQVFAIEMVYVPQGAFAAGSGGTEQTAFTLTTINTATATTPPSGTGLLGGQAGGYPTGQTAPTSASWPNGFNAYYAMKYEMTQQGYVDFLNTLTYTQQVTRTTMAPNSAAGTGALEPTNQYRTGIDVQTPGIASTTPAVYACNLNGNAVYGESTDGKDIACGMISWGDITAYLDWCGLRPLTELEFEKACRGTILPVANEFPWGTTDLSSNVYTLNNAGATNEGIATNYSALSNSANNSAAGSISPLRVGIFAANGGNTGRATAGAGYYGNMELGGNLWERTVTIETATGRAFTGAHGNGTLAATGDPDVASWPAPTTGDGAGLRGGAFNTQTIRAQVSNRFDTAGTYSGRSNGFGCRGARSAP